MELFLVSMEGASLAQSCILQEIANQKVLGMLKIIETWYWLI